MKSKLKGALAGALIVGACLPALAQTTTPSAVVVPYGSWVGSVVIYLTPAIVALVAAAIGWLAKRLGPVGASLKEEQLQQTVQNAVDYAAATIGHAEAGKTVSVEIGNAVVSRAVEFLIAHAPQIANALGSQLRPLIIAKMSKRGMLGPDVAAPSNGQILVPANSTAAAK